MADPTARGRFLWHDLLTSDPTAAHRFYGKAVGWKPQPFDADPNYVMFAAPTGPLGGVGKSEDQPPHWVAYIGTPDIDATLERAKNRGANVVTDITQIPNGGSYAVLKDPQGAIFGAYQYATDPGAGSSPQRGEFSWYELGTSNAEAALDFYSDLFGWEQLAKHHMGPMGFYYLFGRNGTQAGGLFTKPAAMGSPAWMVYIRVKDMDQTVSKVKAAGGTLINGPMEVPGGDWIAQFTDPQGAMFAVHVLKADRKSVKTPADTTASAAQARSAPVKKRTATKTVRGKKRTAKTAKKPARSKPAARTKKTAVKAGKSTRKAAKKKSRPVRKSPVRKAKRARKSK